METLLQLQQQLPPLVLDTLKLCIWLVLLMTIFVPLERLYALHPQKVFRKSFPTDLAYYFLSSLVPRLVILVPMTMLAWVLHRVVPEEFYWWVEDMPTGLRLAAALVVGEIGFYWGHRWMHSIPWLWPFHAVHHSAEEIDWLVNTRAHPVDIVFTRLCGLIPMYLLGLAQPSSEGFDLVPVIVTVAGTIWGFFIHSNIRWRLGWFEWLLSTPGFHHWHHTNDSPQVLNKNYASMLPLVDKCFGTFYLPKQWPGKYGTDEPVAPGLAHQLIDPLLHRGRSLPHLIDALPAVVDKERA